jgi:hypothetical protein
MGDLKRSTLRLLLGVSLSGLLAIAALPAKGADVVAVCPPEFRAAFSTWIAHRQADGLTVEVVKSHHDPTSLARRIGQAADSSTRFVVLVGDAPVIGERCNPQHQIPVHYRPTTVSAKYGSTPTLSSDLAYGDFNGDANPEAVVGRLPVDTAEELSRLIDRIIAHEACCDFGPWRSRVDLIGGVGGFSPMIDSTIETATRTIVSGVLPIETKMTIAHASPGHRFYPKQQFTEAVIERYQQGARFWVYAGHGQVTELDRVPARTGIPILDSTSVKRLNRPKGASPIAMILACYSGALDATKDSIAEEMVCSEGGPIAVLAGSRVTMPYGNTTAAVCMINAIYAQKQPRLGQAWHSALNEMYREKNEDQSSTRVMIDAMATIFSPKGTVLVDERREHMFLYNLIGDPTLRLHHPQEVQVSVPAGHDVGQTIQVTASSPLAGDITVSLDRPLGAAIDGDPNATNIASLTTQVLAAESKTLSFKIPTEITGPIVVRAIVAGEKTWAAGAARTIVR